MRAAKSLTKGKNASGTPEAVWAVVLEGAGKRAKIAKVANI
jgi:hypothetical protein